MESWLSRESRKARNQAISDKTSYLTKLKSGSSQPSRPRPWCPSLSGIHHLVIRRILLSQFKENSGFSVCCPTPHLWYPVGSLGLSWARILLDPINQNRPWPLMFPLSSPPTDSLLAPWPYILSCHVVFGIKHSYILRSLSPGCNNSEWNLFLLLWFYQLCLFL